MQYIYETHLHTREGSRCGRVHGEDYIPYMIDKGYAGMIVTDHFFTGNCAVPHFLSWEERVDMYMSGYERALKASEGTSFTVLFGIEYNFECDEYLIYGVDRRWLLDRPDIERMTRSEVYSEVHSAGGIMVQAHPYRERDYLSDIKLAPKAAIDGVEIYNAANKPNMNALGYEFALPLGLPMTAGSDIHFYNDNDMGGMLFAKKINSIEEFVSAVRANEGTPVRLSPDGSITPVVEIREQTMPTELPTLPVLYPEGK